MSDARALVPLALPRGAKKGGGRAPQEAADTLRSTQIVEVVMLVSEGEAQGLVNGLKSVFLDQVPIENADGSLNFDNVEFAYVTGTQGQAAIDGLSAVQNEVAVGLQVDQASPVVRTITNPLVDHVRVTIGVPQLTFQDSATGDLQGTGFEWAVEIQSAGGGYVERHREVVEGKTTSLYATAVKIALTGAAPWDVRVRRINPDPTTANVVNRFSWQSYTEITSVKLRYPNSAVARLRVNAQNFARIPLLAFDWLGQRVNIPSNYDPIVRTYGGVWDGTFTTGWTNCPPWVVYDAVQHPRYGLGAFVPAALQDKWTLYAIAQYCDALVPDGRGGTEPRFACNVNLEVAEEAYKVLQDLVAVFRGMLFWSAGGVSYAQDAPSAPVHLFTPANVADGHFSYSDASEKTKHSMFVCWWNDTKLFGEAVPEVYVDEALVARYGLRTLELRPLGIASRGQAARACRWARHSEQLEGNVVTFEVGSDGVAVAPGRVFKIADPNEQGERLGGRVHAATASQVTLDAPVTLQPGEAYTLTVLQADPAAATRLLTEERVVTNAAGTTNVIDLATPFGAAPLAGSVWVLQSDAIGATTWRCLSVEEVKGRNRFRVTGVAHDPSKYDAIELGLKLDTRPVSRLGLVPPRPASILLTETPYLAGTQTLSRVTVSWPEPAQGLTYTVSWRLNSGPWVDIPATSANSVEIDRLARGVLEVSLKSVNALGNASTARTAQATLLGKTAAAANVTGLAARVSPDGVLITWNESPDVDYWATELRVGSSWAASSLLFIGPATAYTWLQPAQGSYTVWARHWDTSGNDSAGDIAVAVNVTAGRDTVLVVHGVAGALEVRGNSVEKVSAVGWNAGVYSSAPIRGGCEVSCLVGAGSGPFMLALNADPLTDASYTSLDRAIYWTGSDVQVYESGALVAGGLGGVFGSTLRVRYDETGYFYYVDGALVRQVAAAPGLTHWLDMSFHGIGAKAINLRFDPLSAAPRGNLVDSSTWVVGTSGSQGAAGGIDSAGYFGAIGQAEDTIVLAPAPDGVLRPVWQATSVDPYGTNDGDGGFESGRRPIAATKIYRWSVWLKVVARAGAQHGSFYLGAGPSSAGERVADIGSGVLNENPYFASNSRTGLALGRWYLLVGFMLPHTIGSVAPNPSMSGIYDGATGQRVAGGVDYKWLPDAARINLRTYQYYADAGNVQQFWGPRLEMCDGDEPSIPQLLAPALKAAATIYDNAFDATYNLNGSFTRWQLNSNVPEAWTHWAGGTVSRETVIVADGPNAVRVVTGGVDSGLLWVLGFGGVARPAAGSFLECVVSAYVANNISGGGSPGVLARLYTNAGLSTWRDTVVTFNKTLGGWQQVPLKAGVQQSEEIHKIELYCMGCWVSGLGVWNGEIVFDKVDQARFVQPSGPVHLTPDALGPVQSVTPSGAVAITTQIHIPDGYTWNTVVAGAAAFVAQYNGVATVTFSGLADYTAGAAAQYQFSVQNRQASYDGWNLVNGLVPVGTTRHSLNQTRTFNLVAGTTYEFQAMAARTDVSDTMTVYNMQLSVQVRYTP